MAYTYEDLWENLVSGFYLEVNQQSKLRRAG